MPSDQIRVSYMISYPFVNGNCSHIPRLRIGSSCLRPGMAIEILNLITTYLNLTINVVKVIPNVKGWTNTVDEVFNNETDTYSLFLSNDFHNDYENDLNFTKMVFTVYCFLLKFLKKKYVLV